MYVDDSGTPVDDTVIYLKILEDKRSQIESIQQITASSTTA